MSEMVHGAVLPAGTVRDQSYVETYANQLRIGATLSDLTMIFGVAEDLGPNRIVTKDKVALHLAPVTMKILMLHLQVVIEAYEEIVGQIPIPMRLTQQLPAVKDGLKRTFLEQMGATPNAERTGK